MYEYDNQKSSSSFVPNKSDVCISNSLFHDCTSSSNGGAVSSSSTSVNRMFIEDTTFTTCKTTSYYGGWIFFQNTNNGECVIFHTCGFDCSSKYSGSSSSTLGQYAFIQTKSNDDTYKNEVNESTMTGITKESAYPYYALRLYYSNIVCSSVNITNNECYYYPALGCYPTIKTDVVTCLIMYTSIVNNTAKAGCGCIVLSNSGSTQTISTSNIINNKQEDSSSYGTIETYGNLCINESCIIGNNEGNKVFYEGGGSSYQIKIINCTLDSDIMTKQRYTGSFTIISSKQYSFINALSHIVTQKCDSFFDSYGTLTAAPPVPGKRPKRTKNRIIKREKDQLTRFMEYVFLISLIPSDTAIANWFHIESHFTDKCPIFACRIFNM